MNLVFTDDMEKRYRVLISRGFTADDLCEELVIDRATLYRNIRKRNLPRPARPVALPKRPLPSVEEYKQFKRDGFTDNKIARMIGITPKTLWRWKQKMGLPIVRRKAYKRGKVQRVLD